jgi:hypothetical protein
MDAVILDLQQHGIIKKMKMIVNAFRCFLVAKPSEAASFIIDLSPWTQFYKLPAVTVYSVAEVLVALRPEHQMIQIDLSSGFFQLKIHPGHQKFYSTNYKGEYFAMTRLPMGHALALSIDYAKDSTGSSTTFTPTACLTYPWSPILTTGLSTVHDSKFQPLLPRYSTWGSPLTSKNLIYSQHQL